ncbi:MAG: EF-P lysine aminoacylase EpmA [Candidatus Gracilibacteria bacterium]|nr:EF-P lysine aminoacylase EpmA [bacterium]MDZ4217042.1 EF-P lysine aminoacylase EpmA [Candidatus Gracilibacteria bacterium]
MQNWQLIRDGQLDKDTFVQRARILDLMREWFRGQGFLEVETPLMVKHPGMEPHLNLFSSEFVSEDGKYRDRRYLHTSPEYAMKKLLGAGFEKIFQLTKVFRNGEDGGAHNPEFTMVEWYRANADYMDVMKDTEVMVRWISSQLAVGSWQNYENSNCELHTVYCKLFQKNWERLSVREAFQRYAEMNLDELRDVETLKAAVLKKGYELNAEYSWDDLFFLVFLNEVEPKLGHERPVFLYDYPATQAALAKRKDDDPFWAERFELYINGVELCNAFTELVDPVEQRFRLEEEWQLREEMGKETYDLDESFIEALETMPPSGGNALGIDRLVMVLLGMKSIEEVLLFPWGDVS